jgi:nitroreductase
MEFSEVINNRRSIRHYNDKEVSTKDITTILQSGILSPSAHNRQPWHFIVVRDKLKKEEIANILKEKTDVSTTLTCEVIENCSAIILVFADITDELMDTQSIGACIENMILQATDLKIGSLWIGYIVKIEKELQEMFNCNKKLMATIALGYSDIFPKPRPRKTLDEVTVWY